MLSLFFSFVFFLPSSSLFSPGPYPPLLLLCPLLYILYFLQLLPFSCLSFLFSCLLSLLSSLHHSCLLSPLPSSLIFPLHSCAFFLLPSVPLSLVPILSSSFLLTCSFSLIAFLSLYILLPLPSPSVFSPFWSPLIYPPRSTALSSSLLTFHLSLFFPFSHSSLFPHPSIFPFPLLDLLPPFTTPHHSSSLIPHVPSSSLSHFSLLFFFPTLLTSILCSSFYCPLLAPSLFRFLLFSLLSSSH